MNVKKFGKEYEAPAISLLDIRQESVLCTSNAFDVELEGMEENDYTFNW